MLSILVAVVQFPPAFSPPALCVLEGNTLIWCTKQQAFKSAKVIAPLQVVKGGNEGRLAVTPEELCWWGAVAGRWWQCGEEERGRWATPWAGPLVGMPMPTGQCHRKSVQRGLILIGGHEYIFSYRMSPLQSASLLCRFISLWVRSPPHVYSFPIGRKKQAPGDVQKGPCISSQSLLSTH